ncbi:MAG TPA: hypothetical protein VM432_11510 [Bdellovibrionales bacterium]|nr:hypothetical protein [Bdellovibrionales bacterium]
MRFSFILLSLLFATVSQAEISQDVGVLGFQAWKATRVEEAKQQLEKVKVENPPKTDLKPQQPQSAARQQKFARVDQRLSQAQLNLEIAEDFSVNDYFVLYLNQFKDRSAFIEAAQKLNSQEAADLMMAYQKHLAAAAAPDAPPPAIAPVRR